MKRIATLIAALIALTATASAVAASGNFKQSGFIVGDKAASVKLRVKVKDDEVVKVAGFKAQNVLAKCKDKDIRIQLIALEPVPVDGDGDFKVRLSDGDGGILRITGTVGDDGESTKGSVKTNDFQQGKDTCRVSKQKFRTSVR